MQKSIAQLTAVFDLLTQPVILLKNDTIIYRNSAAAALMVQEGANITSLLAEPLPKDTDTYVVLTLGGENYSAVVHPLEQSMFCLVAQRLQDETLPAHYLSVVSSQIRKPLGDLLIAVKHLLPDLEQLDYNSAATQQACRIYKGLYQLQRLAGQLSDGSQLAQGIQSLCFQRTELKQFLQSLADTATDMLACMDIQFRFSGLPQLKYANIDPQKLERAIWNLLSNAIAYSAAGSEVELSAELTSTHLLIRVINRGSGIDPTVRSSVFDRYAHHPGLSDYRSGLGFGLSIVRQVATLHGGTTILCTQPDGSTCVTMSIGLSRTSSELRSPIADFDYSGGMNHALIELSNVLPVEMYHPLDLDG